MSNRQVEVLAAVREHFSLNPLEPVPDPRELARTLWRRYLPYCPDEAEVEAALEVLTVEGEVLP